MEIKSNVKNIRIEATWQMNTTRVSNFFIETRAVSYSESLVV